MGKSALRLTFRGVRGSVPTPDLRNLGYGGHTSCLEVAFGADHRLLIDCGTGLSSVEPDLPQPIGPEGLRFDVLLTHYHADHLAGLPFFKPLYDARSLFTFYGFGWQGGGVQAVLEGTIRPPWFPIRLADTPCQKRYVDLDGRTLALGGLRITCARLNHPQGVTAYRLDHGDRSVVFATDHERGDAEHDAQLRALARGADVLIHDSQYTPAEYEASHRGWGHSTWRHAIDAAAEAGAGRLILFHHDPQRSDVDLETMLDHAREPCPGVEAAREGGSFEL